MLNNEQKLFLITVFIPDADNTDIFRHIIYDPLSFYLLENFFPLRDQRLNI